ncbi:hypothetical protein GTZ89_20880 [Streptomyces sp. SID8382]|uniref:hypothetical protein n=1 Tax=Streptomyces malaysiensis TaxID=92644 RepID=UPI000C2B8B4C|nr:MULTISPECIES: hypothetical protein [unclassified Streptomyces]MYX58050.1 hypothetical protein [Streptomyces sp. SID8382]
MARPDGVLGILWPSMSADFHQPLGALGLLLPFGVAAAVLSSTMTGRILARMHIGQLLSASTVLSVVALLGYGSDGRRRPEFRHAVAMGIRHHRRGADDARLRFPPKRAALGRPPGRPCDGSGP